MSKRESKQSHGRRPKCRRPQMDGAAHCKGAKFIYHHQDRIKTQLSELSSMREEITISGRLRLAASNWRPQLQPRRELVRFKSDIRHGSRLIDGGDASLWRHHHHHHRRRASANDWPRAKSRKRPAPAACLRRRQWWWFHDKASTSSSPAWISMAMLLFGTLWLIGVGQAAIAVASASGATATVFNDDRPAAANQLGQADGSSAPAAAAASFANGGIQIEVTPVSMRGPPDLLGVSEHELLTQLLQSTGSFEEANRLLETLLNSSADQVSERLHLHHNQQHQQQQQQPRPPSTMLTDFNQVKASLDDGGGGGGGSTIPTEPATGAAAAAGAAELASSGVQAPQQQQQQQAPPVRVFLPAPLAAAQTELTLQAAKRPPEKGGGGGGGLLLDEVLAAAVSNANLNANLNVHYDDEKAADPSIAAIKADQQLLSSPLPLSTQRAINLMQASKQIQYLMSPPEPQHQAHDAQGPSSASRTASRTTPTTTFQPHSAPAAAAAGVNLTGASSELVTNLMGAPRANVFVRPPPPRLISGDISSRDEDGLNNNESYSTLMIRSAQPAHKLIANYSHWINHELDAPPPASSRRAVRLPDPYKPKKPDVFKYIEPGSLTTTTTTSATTTTTLAATDNNNSNSSGSDKQSLSAGSTSQPKTTTHPPDSTKASTGGGRLRPVATKEAATNEADLMDENLKKESTQANDVKRVKSAPPAQANLAEPAPSDRAKQPTSTTQSTKLSRQDQISSNASSMHKIVFVNSMPQWAASRTTAKQRVASTAAVNLQTIVSTSTTASRIDGSPVSTIAESNAATLVPQTTEQATKMPAAAAATTSELAAFTQSTPIPAAVDTSIDSTTTTSTTTTKPSSIATQLGSERTKPTKQQTMTTTTVKSDAKKRKLKKVKPATATTSLEHPSTTANNWAPTQAMTSRTTTVILSTTSTTTSSSSSSTTTRKPSPRNIATNRKSSKSSSKSPKQIKNKLPVVRLRASTIPITTSTFATAPTTEATTTTTTTPPPPPPPPTTTTTTTTAMMTMMETAAPTAALATAPTTEATTLTTTTTEAPASAQGSSLAWGDNTMETETQSSSSVMATMTTPPPTPPTLPTEAATAATTTTTTITTAMSIPQSSSADPGAPLSSRAAKSLKLAHLLLGTSSVLDRMPSQRLRTASKTTTTTTTAIPFEQTENYDDFSRSPATRPPQMAEFQATPPIMLMIANEGDDFAAPTPDTMLDSTTDWPTAASGGGGGGGDHDGGRQSSSGGTTRAANKWRAIELPLRQHTVSVAASTRTERRPAANRKKSTAASNAAGDRLQQQQQLQLVGPANGKQQGQLAAPSRAKSSTAPRRAKPMDHDHSIAKLERLNSKPASSSSSRRSTTTTLAVASSTSTPATVLNEQEPTDYSSQTSGPMFAGADATPSRASTELVPNPIMHTLVETTTSQPTTPLYETFAPNTSPVSDSEIATTATSAGIEQSSIASTVPTSLAPDEAATITTSEPSSTTTSLDDGGRTTIARVASRFDSIRARPTSNGGGGGGGSLSSPSPLPVVAVTNQQRPLPAEWGDERRVGGNRRERISQKVRNAGGKKRVANKPHDKQQQTDVGSGSKVLKSLIDQQQQRQRVGQQPSSEVAAQDGYNEPSKQITTNSNGNENNGSQDITTNSTDWLALAPQPASIIQPPSAPLAGSHFGKRLIESPPAAPATNQQQQQQQQQQPYLDIERSFANDGGPQMMTISSLNNSQPSREPARRWTPTLKKEQSQPLAQAQAQIQPKAARTKTPTQTQTNRARASGRPLQSVAIEQRGVAAPPPIRAGQPPPPPATSDRSAFDLIRPHHLGMIIEEPVHVLKLHHQQQQHLQSEPPATVTTLANLSFVSGEQPNDELMDGDDSHRTESSSSARPVSSSSSVDAAAAAATSTAMPSSAASLPMAVADLLPSILFHNRLSSIFQYKLANRTSSSKAANKNDSDDDDDDDSQRTTRVSQAHFVYPFEYQAIKERPAVFAATTAAAAAAAAATAAATAVPSTAKPEVQAHLDREQQAKMIKLLLLNGGKPMKTTTAAAAAAAAAMEAKQTATTSITSEPNLGFDPNDFAPASATNGSSGGSSSGQSIETPPTSKRPKVVVRVVSAANAASSAGSSSSSSSSGSGGGNSMGRWRRERHRSTPAIESNLFVSSSSSGISSDAPPTGQGAPSESFLSSQQRQQQQQQLARPALNNLHDNSLDRFKSAAAAAAAASGDNGTANAHGDHEHHSKQQQQRQPSEQSDTTMESNGEKSEQTALTSTATTTTRKQKDDDVGLLLDLFVSSNGPNDGGGSETTPSPSRSLGSSGDRDTLLAATRVPPKSVADSKVKTIAIEEMGANQRWKALSQSGGQSSDSTASSAAKEPRKRRREPPGLQPPPPPSSSTTEAATTTTTTTQSPSTAAQFTQSAADAGRETTLEYSGGSLSLHNLFKRLPQSVLSKQQQQQQDESIYQKHRRELKPLLGWPSATTATTNTAAAAAATGAAAFEKTNQTQPLAPPPPPLDLMAELASQEQRRSSSLSPLVDKYRAQSLLNTMINLGVPSSTATSTMLVQRQQADTSAAVGQVDEAEQQRRQQQQQQRAQPNGRVRIVKVEKVRRKPEPHQSADTAAAAAAKAIVSTTTAGSAAKNTSFVQSGELNDSIVSQASIGSEPALVLVSSSTASSPRPVHVEPTAITTTTTTPIPTTTTAASTTTSTEQSKLETSPAVIGVPVLPDQSGPRGRLAFGSNTPEADQEFASSSSSKGNHQPDDPDLSTTYLPPIETSTRQLSTSKRPAVGSELANANVNANQSANPSANSSATGDATFGGKTTFDDGDFWPVARNQRQLNQATTQLRPANSSTSSRAPSLIRDQISSNPINGESRPISARPTLGAFQRVAVVTIGVCCTLLIVCLLIVAVSIKCRKGCCCCCCFGGSSPRSSKSSPSLQARSSRIHRQLDKEAAAAAAAARRRRADGQRVAGSGQYFSQQQPQQLQPAPHYDNKKRSKSAEKRRAVVAAAAAKELIGGRMMMGRHRSKSHTNLLLAGEFLPDGRQLCSSSAESTAGTSSACLSSASSDGQLNYIGRTSRPNDYQHTRPAQVFNQQPQPQPQPMTATLRQRLSGTITSRLLRLHLPRFLPYLVPAQYAYDHNHHHHQQQQQSKQQQQHSNLHYSNPIFGGLAGAGHSRKPASSYQQQQQQQANANFQLRPAEPQLAAARQQQQQQLQSAKSKYLARAQASSFQLQQPAQQQPQVHQSRAIPPVKSPAPPQVAAGVRCHCPSCSSSNATGWSFNHEQPPCGGHKSSNPTAGTGRPKLPFGAASSVLRQQQVESSSQQQQQQHFRSQNHQSRQQQQQPPQVPGRTRERHSQGANSFVARQSQQQQQRTTEGSLADTVSQQMDNEHHLLIDDRPMPYLAPSTSERFSHIQDIVYDENDEECRSPSELASPAPTTTTAGLHRPLTAATANGDHLESTSKRADDSESDNYYNFSAAAAAAANSYDANNSYDQSRHQPKHPIQASGGGGGGQLTERVSNLRPPDSDGWLQFQAAAAALNDVGSPTTRTQPNSTTTAPPQPAPLDKPSSNCNCNLVLYPL